MSDDDYNTINLVISRSDGNEIKYKIAKKDLGDSIVLPKRYETEADKVEKNNILQECLDSKDYSDKQVELLKKIPKDYIYISNPQQLVKGRHLFAIDNLTYDFQGGIIIKTNKRFVVTRDTRKNFPRYFHDQNYYFMKKFFRKSDLRLQLEKLVDDSAEKPKSMEDPGSDNEEWETDTDADTEWETDTDTE